MGTVPLTRCFILRLSYCPLTPYAFAFRPLRLSSFHPTSLALHIVSTSVLRVSSQSLKLCKATSLSSSHGLAPGSLDGRQPGSSSLRSPMTPVVRLQVIPTIVCGGHARPSPAARHALSWHLRVTSALSSLLPVVRGRKTKAKTFPGAGYTTTVECFVPATGRGIQGATSHHPGQNSSKMLDISCQDPKGPAGKARDHAYQNSWGLTARTIGVMIMVHGDDRGLVIPLGVAGVQVVITPVGLSASMPEDQKQRDFETCRLYIATLEAAGVRVKLDDQETLSPGNKFDHWEMKSVPLRIEPGLKAIG